jgi:hypothetical protein
VTAGCSLCKRPASFAQPLVQRRSCTSHTPEK